MAMLAGGNMGGAGMPAPPPLGSFQHQMAPLAVGGGGSGHSNAPSAFRPPLQSPSFFAGRPHGGCGDDAMISAFPRGGLPHQSDGRMGAEEGGAAPGGGSGGGYEGGYSFKHSVREVPLHHLSEEAQRVLMQQQQQQQQAAALGPQEVAGQYFYSGGNGRGAAGAAAAEGGGPPQWRSVGGGQYQPQGPASAYHTPLGPANGGAGYGASSTAAVAVMAGGGPAFSAASPGSHYEYVPPSNWQPDEEDLGDEFLGLYRR